MESHSKEIPGYAYGADTVETSSISLKELQELKISVGLREEDERYLRLAGEVLGDQVKQVVEHWRSRIIASIPNLARHSRSPEGNPLRNIWRRAINALSSGFWTPVFGLMTKPGSITSRRSLFVTRA